ncbi:hypothetical protein Q8F55_003323 [Vanrija albida]|uniref:Granulins domain-containing protein n=1 Tax=Vanrija albida TaxID=181172 RepID=A0ABR3Q3W7_9TREE
MLLPLTTLLLAPATLALGPARADGGLWLGPAPVPNLALGTHHARALECPASHPVACAAWPNACTQRGKTCCDLAQGTSSCDEGEYCVMYRGEVKCCPNGENCNEEEYEYTTDTLTRTATAYETQTETVAAVVTVSSVSYAVAPVSNPPVSNPSVGGATNSSALGSGGTSAPTSASGSASASPTPQVAPISGTSSAVRARAGLGVLVAAGLVVAAAL